MKPSYASLDSILPPRERLDFHSATDAERGIIEVVYKCIDPDCGAIDTERLFVGFAVPESLGCVKCGAGLRGNPGGMYPLAGNEAAVN